MKSIFFVGKGGAGKSTLSALTGLFLARKTHRVLLASLDPAHNLCDIFQAGLCEKPTQIAPSLNLIEIDLSTWTRRYLDGIQKQMERLEDSRLVCQSFHSHTCI